MRVSRISNDRRARLYAISLICGLSVLASQVHAETPLTHLATRSCMSMTSTWPEATTAPESAQRVRAALPRRIYMVMTFAGGIPLKRSGKVVGAVGVSGGSGAQDQAVAEAGASAFG